MPFTAPDILYGFVAPILAAIVAVLAARRLLPVMLWACTAGPMARLTDVKRVLAVAAIGLTLAVVAVVFAC